MENWDKGIQFFEEAAPVAPEVLEKLRLMQDYHAHRAGVHLIMVPLRNRRPRQALQLVQDPVTGAWGLPTSEPEEDAHGRPKSLPPRGPISI